MEESRTKLGTSRRTWWPRFGLRTLFVLITLISLPIGWIAYQLNWIRQRHEFLHRTLDAEIDYSGPVLYPKCPWPLNLFGEQAHDIVFTPQRTADEARRLFPEAQIVIVSN